MNIACKFCSNLSKLGVGVLVRDSSCLVIAARTFTLRITGEILQSVAMTAVESIRFIDIGDLFIDIGILRVELEFDHEDLFCLIQQLGPCLASINNLVDNIILSKPYFEILTFSYVTILFNKVTCVLATEAVSSLSSQV